MRRQAAGRANLQGAELRGADLRRADRGLLLPRRLPEPPAAPARRHRSPGRPAAAGP
ncbi:pentapeptide repeat-containing protein [Streptosporangium sp. NPDC002524]|uniref:pentapeptide repeat-containing protein n=1 Tax=Streptosporangium sp. NPDC002524 TaxID=3154537 RepID=UPI0033341D66